MLQKLLKVKLLPYCFLDKNKKELLFKAILGKKSKEIKKYKVKLGEGIAGWVAEKGQSLIVNDVNNNMKWKKTLMMPQNLSLNPLYVFLCL